MAEPSTRDQVTVEQTGSTETHLSTAVADGPKKRDPARTGVSGWAIWLGALGVPLLLIVSALLKPAFFEYFAGVIFVGWLAYVGIAGPNAHAHRVWMMVGGLAFWGLAVSTILIPPAAFVGQYFHAGGGALAVKDLSTLKDLITMLGVAGAIAFFMFRLMTGQFNDNLAISLAARSARENEAHLILSLEKGGSGSLRIIEAYVALRGKEGPRSIDAAFQEFETPKRLSLTRPPKHQESAVMSPGDKSQFVAKIAASPGNIVDVAIIARRHPFHTLWYCPQWRASCVVEPVETEK